MSIQDDVLSPKNDLDSLKSIYQKRWEQHGHSPLSLGWTKGKQDTRFDILLGGFPCENQSFLDVGCGFGDLISALRKKTSSFSYLGVDMVPQFLNQARSLYSDPRIRFQVCDFLSYPFDEMHDYAVASGIFAFYLAEVDNYDYIHNVLQKMFVLSRKAVSVDFLSDRVNFKRHNIFYANPGRILEIGLSLTRRIQLRHDYMPFEFSLTLFKNSDYDESDTIFKEHKHAG